MQELQNCFCKVANIYKMFLPLRFFQPVSNM
jgi:hypothetical protein